MKKIKLLVPTIILVAIILVSCRPKVDLNKEMEDILKYLEKGKNALIERNVENWVSLYADSCIYPVKGEIYQYSQDSLRKIFGKAFSDKNHRAISLENIKKPIVHISNDATMAWYVANFYYNYALKDSIGNEKLYKAQGADLFVLEKKNSKWVEVTGVETHKTKE